MLLPTGSEERVVLGVGSIPVAILLSCRNVRKCMYYYCINMGSKNKKHLRGSSRATILPLDIILTMALCALVSIIA